MLAWAANEGHFPEVGYDGTVRSLAHHYQADELSPYRRCLKWNSQEMQTKCIKIVVEAVGARQIGKPEETIRTLARQLGGTERRRARDHGSRSTV
jgi:hypothetical protein